MFGLIVVSIFIVFFILMIVVKDQKVLLKIAKGFLIIVLGGLAVMGVLAIFTGIYEALGGECSLKQLLIQVGTGLLFIIFGGVPLYVFFVAREVSLRRFERRKKQYPDAPWMWVNQWSKKRILYASKGPTVLVWFVLLGMVSGLTFVSYMNREAILSKIKSHDLELIVFSIILFLILLAGFSYAISLLRGHFKFGNSFFEMSTHPGIIGGELAGTIQTTMKNIPEKGFDLVLQCGYIDLTSQAGKRIGNTDRTVNIWEAKKTVRLEELTMGPQGVSIPVSFSIPPDAQESDAWSSKRIVWTLSAFSSLEGVSYFSSFDVPVFKTKPMP